MSEERDLNQEFWEIQDRICQPDLKLSTQLKHIIDWVSKKDEFHEIRKIFIWNLIPLVAEEQPYKFHYLSILAKCLYDYKLVYDMKPEKYPNCKINKNKLEKIKKKVKKKEKEKYISSYMILGEKSVKESVQSFIKFLESCEYKQDNEQQLEDLLIQFATEGKTKKNKKMIKTIMKDDDTNLEDSKIEGIDILGHYYRSIKDACVKFRALNILKLLKNDISNNNDDASFSFSKDQFKRNYKRKRIEISRQCWVYKYHNSLLKPSGYSSNFEKINENMILLPSDIAKQHKESYCPALIGNCLRRSFFEEKQEHSHYERLVDIADKIFNDSIKSEVIINDLKLLKENFKIKDKSAQEDSDESTESNIYHLFEEIINSFVEIINNALKAHPNQFEKLFKILYEMYKGIDDEDSKKELIEKSNTFFQKRFINEGVNFDPDYTDDYILFIDKKGSYKESYISTQVFHVDETQINDKEIKDNEKYLIDPSFLYGFGYCIKEDNLEEFKKIFNKSKAKQKYEYFNDSRLTIVSIAALFRATKIIMFLINNGHFVSGRWESTDDEIKYAIRGGSIPILCVFLDHQKTKELSSRDIKNFLDECIEYRNYEAFQLLLNLNPELTMDNIEFNLFPKIECVQMIKKCKISYSLGSNTNSYDYIAIMEFLDMVTNHDSLIVNPEDKLIDSDDSETQDASFGDY